MSIFSRIFHSPCPLQSYYPALIKSGTDATDDKEGSTCDFDWAKPAGHEDRVRKSGKIRRRQKGTMAVAAERAAVRMTRADPSTHWGFRIQGGQEYGGPLLIEKVLEGGLADRAGLLQDDRVLQIGGVHTANIPHRMAEDAIVQSGNNLDIVVERPATRIWRPRVTPMDITPGDATSPPVKYSLAHERAPQATVGSAHNVQPRPFGQPQQQGQQQSCSSSSSAKATEQYNSPESIHSRKTAVEEYLQKTGGLFGTDPKLTQKVEPPAYLKSETLRLIKESESRTQSGPGEKTSRDQKGIEVKVDRPVVEEPRVEARKRIGPAAAPPSFTHQSESFVKLSHALAVEDEPGANEKNGTADVENSSMPSGSPAPGYGDVPRGPGSACDHCGRLIHGIFCKVGEKTLHGECFKCSTCGSLLKHVGYFLINDKLYCDVHARQQRELIAGSHTSGQARPGAQRTFTGTAPNSNYSSSYQYQKTTKTTTTNQRVPQRPYAVSITTTGTDQNMPSYVAPVPPAPAVDVPAPPAPPPVLSAQSAPPPPPDSGYHSLDYKDAVTQQDESVTGNHFETVHCQRQGSASPATPCWQQTREEKRMESWSPRNKESKDFGSDCPPPPLPALPDSKLLISYGPVAFRKAGVAEAVIHAVERAACGPGYESAYAVTALNPAHQKMESHCGCSGSPHRNRTGRRDIAWKVPGREPEKGRASPDETTKAVKELSGPESGHSAVERSQWSIGGRGEVRNGPSVWSRAQAPSGDQPSSQSILPRADNKNCSSLLETQEEPTDPRHPSTFGNHSLLFKINNYAVDKGVLLPANLPPPGQGQGQKLMTTGSQEKICECRITAATTETKWTSGGPFGKAPARRGIGILKQSHESSRAPVCESCNREIRGPFVLALSKAWCPDHFVCASAPCRRQLLEIGFIEENGNIYCEFCYEKHFAPTCSKCSRAIVGDCLTALDRQWHPECFTCTRCRKPFGSTSFFVENGQAYCEADWNQLFTTKCCACHFAIEAGDRWVEALGNAYHSDCFSCSVCQKNLEGQSFYAKAGRPYCKDHA